jgi:hypothetical protein
MNIMIFRQVEQMMRAIFGLEQGKKYQNSMVLAGQPIPLRMVFLTIELQLLRYINLVIYGLQLGIVSG